MRRLPVRLDPLCRLLGVCSLILVDSLPRRELATIAARLRGFLRWRLFGRLIVAGLGLGGSFRRGRAAIRRRLACLTALLLLHSLVERLLDRLPAALGDQVCPAPAGRLRGGGWTGFWSTIGLVGGNVDEAGGVGDGAAVGAPPGGATVTSVISSSYEGLLKPNHRFLRLLGHSDRTRCPALYFSTATRSARWRPSLSSMYFFSFGFSLPTSVRPCARPTARNWRLEV